MKWTSPQVVHALEAARTNVCRIVTALDWWAERFGSGVIISHRRDLPADALPGIEAWAAACSLDIRRIYARRLVVGPGEDNKPVLLKGDADSEHTVSEAGLSYQVDFLAGYSCGLFLDQRANRARLHALRPSRLLNTFAYTCSFSVVAASSGAQTLSVDLAKSALARGRRNFEINHLSLDHHRFVADDVLQVLPRLARRGEQFDAIILDPPTFSRAARGRRFQVERDFSHLLDLALACAAPRAAILLSTNCSSLPVSRLRDLASALVPSARFHSEPPLPDIPSSHAASALWMHL